jgi:hypothetical protein
MGRGSVRAGAPTQGTQAAAGTDNSLTDPRIVIFAPGVRPCWVRLASPLTVATSHVLVKVNTETDGTVSDDFSTGTPAHLTLSSTSETVDLSDGGQIVVHSVSFVTQNASDDLDDVMLVGFSP